VGSVVLEYAVVEVECVYEPNQKCAEENLLVPEYSSLQYAFDFNVWARMVYEYLTGPYILY
jgi:hypothetical protein